MIKKVRRKGDRAKMRVFMNLIEVVKFWFLKKQSKLKMVVEEPLETI